MFFFGSWLLAPSPYIIHPDTRTQDYKSPFEPIISAVGQHIILGKDAVDGALKIVFKAGAFEIDFCCR